MPREKVFISYSHRDRGWLERLSEHVAALERQGLIHTWSDIQIEVGAAWQEKIDGALKESRVAVLLISPAFLASPYIWEKEMSAILAHAEGGMKILPLVVRPCAWRLEDKLGSLQARPGEGRALSMGTDAQIDLDLAAFVYELAALVERFPGDLVVGQELELAEGYRVEAGQTAVSGRGDVRMQPPRGVTSPELSLRSIPRSWTGAYNDNVQLKLTIHEWLGSRFWGEIDYVGSGTLTWVEGRIVEDIGETAHLHQSLENEPWEINEAALPLVFRETGYVREGSKSIDFEGEYRAMVSDESALGAWFQVSRIAGFRLDDQG
jgi:hypothetical protein